MDAHEIRRMNLVYWADKLGRKTFAQKMGYSDENYINLLYGGHSKLGTRNAAKFAQILKLETNWFNEEHPDLWETGSGFVSEKAVNYSAVTNLDDLIDQLSHKGLVELLNRISARLAELGDGK